MAEPVTQARSLGAGAGEISASNRLSAADGAAHGGGLDRAAAESYALAYRCLADPTRILLLNRLARARRPLLVGEIVGMVDVGQSTVSHHLRILLEGGFVRVRREGTSSVFDVNPECLGRFPATAAIIMDQAPVGVDACSDCASLHADSACTGCDCQDVDAAGGDLAGCTGCDC